MWRKQRESDRSKKERVDPTYKLVGVGKVCIGRNSSAIVPIENAQTRRRPRLTGSLRVFRETSLLGNGRPQDAHRTLLGSPHRPLDTSLHDLASRLSVGRLELLLLPGSDWNGMESNKRIKTVQLKPKKGQEYKSDGNAPAPGCVVKTRMGDDSRSALVRRPIHGPSSQRTDPIEEEYGRSVLTSGKENDSELGASVKPTETGTEVT
jgi:hypothetical protein